MRALLFLALAACAARSPSATTAAPADAAKDAFVPHETSAGTLALFPGTVTEDTDWGSEGTLTVETPAKGLLQQFNWLGDTSDPAERARLSWRVMRGLVRQSAGVDVPEEPTLGTATVAGQPAVTWDMRFGSESIQLSLWTCPDAGATAWLVTGGPQGWTADTHAKSVASATCATAPVAFDDSKIPWEVAAGPEWEVQPAEKMDSITLLRTDRAAVAHVSVSGIAPAAAGTDPCRVMLDEVFGSIREAYAIDPASVRDRDVGVCSRSFEGSMEGRAVRGVFTQHACTATSGYLTYCLLLDPAAPLDACDAVVRCKP